MPIGNLTSQIFANIYFNEFDRYVAHTLKPLGYLRYGDDFLLFAKQQHEVADMRDASVRYLNTTLGLEINSKADRVKPVRHGMHFLGVNIFAAGKVVDQRNGLRAQQRVTERNAASYYGLINQHGSRKYVKVFDWIIGQHNGQL